MMNTSQKYKQLANRILLLSALIYVLVFAGQMYVVADWYGALYWMAQSALIGSVADWFAVTALFRKPLGFPYHTALIPSNKARIVDGMVQLVEEKLLTKEQWNGLLSDVKITYYMDGFMCSSQGREALRSIISKGVEILADRVDRDKLANLGADYILQQSGTWNIGSLVQSYLKQSLRSEWGKQLAIMVFSKGEAWVSGEEGYRFLRERLEEKVNQSAKGPQKVLMFIGKLFNVVNIEELTRATQDSLVQFFQRWREENSSMRNECFTHWEQMLMEPSWQEDVGNSLDLMYRRWIETLPWKDILVLYVFPHLEKYVRGDGNDPSRFAVEVEEQIHRLWLQYRQDEAFIQQLEKGLQEMATALFMQFYTLPGYTVKQVLNAFDEERLNAFIEEKVGEDLAWIRINGAFVGTVVGLLLWSFLYFIYTPYAVPWIRAGVGI